MSIKSISKDKLACAQALKVLGWGAVVNCHHVASSNNA